MGQFVRVVVASTIVFIGVSGIAYAWPEVCTPANAPLIFNVRFSADHENSVIIRRSSDETDIRMFNNYFGRGAGDVWEQGPGNYEILAEAKECYLIISRHKDGPPDGGRDWFDSVYQIDNTRGFFIISFEDSSDESYDDAIVTVGSLCNQLCAAAVLRET